MLVKQVVLFLCIKSLKCYTQTVKPALIIESEYQIILSIFDHVLHQLLSVLITSIQFLFFFRPRRPTNCPF